MYCASDDDPGLCNTVMLAGPVGSGKSAMVYSCAEKLGFHVMEINAGSVSFLVWL
jgi:deoxyadenosine/deoxycytidine kinase